jgi:hypothetical protein
MELLSTAISGTIAIVTTLLGLSLGLISGLLVWWWKARGLRHMIADEIELNLTALNDWKEGEEWPVRSVYIWTSLQPLAPGVLSRKRIKAVAEFYYIQAEVYRDRKAGLQLSKNNAEKMKSAAVKTLGVLGASPA